jgi:signal transduction histidine kinase
MAAVVSLFIFALLVLLIVLIVRHSKLEIFRLEREKRNLEAKINAISATQEGRSNVMKIAAHDLRNPIGAIVSATDMMLRNVERSNRDLAMLQLIKMSGENSLSLVNDLLDVDSPVQDDELTLVDLHELIRYCVALVRHRADAKEQRIVIRTRPVILKLSAEKMWRVICNLLSNAIKFSPVGAVVSISVEQEGSTVIIAVSDHGIGIPAGAGDKLFDMFTSEKRKGTSGETSYGLGLAISRQIVEGLGGKIWFESEVGDGTTFYVAFHKDMKEMA